LVGGRRRRPRRRVDPLGHLALGGLGRGQGGAGGLLQLVVFIRIVRQFPDWEVVGGEQLVHAVDFALPELGAGRAVEDDRHFPRPV
jgi:hypothetical protein